MEIWILIGVVAIATLAGVVRLLFDGSRKRQPPVVFGEKASRIPAPASMAADRHSLLSDRQSSSDIEDLVQDSPAADSVSAAETVTPATMPLYSATESSSCFAETRRDSLFSNFRGIVDEGDLSAPDPEDLPMTEDELKFGEATSTLAQMLPETPQRKFRQRQDLQAAGYHSRASWLNLSAVRFVLAFVALLVVGIALIVAPPASEPYLMAALIGAPLLGWAVPPLLIAGKANERRADIERSLPDALDMLNMSVSQGLTVHSSLRRIGPEIESAHPALAQELKIVSQQTQMGSLSQALNNFSKRIDSPEVSSFTSLLIQSEATGTSISRALSDYSDSMRSTIRERADSRANAASFKLLFPTVLCLMPSVFMFLLGPAVVELSDFANTTANELLETRSQALNTLDQDP